MSPPIIAIVEARWITAPGRYEVTITGWNLKDHWDGPAAVFNAQDDDGQRLSIRFGLSGEELRSGELLEFITLLTHRRPTKPVGMTTKFFLEMNFNQMVSRRIALIVKRMDQQRLIVADCKSVPSTSRRKGLFGPPYEAR